MGLSGHHNASFSLAAQTETKPSGELTEFVADEGGTESISGGGLLISAYLVIWAVLFGFIYITWKKQRGLKEQLDRMEAALNADTTSQ